MTEKLLAAVSRPVDVGGQEVFMTACAGLAFFPDDGLEGGHLLRNADSALHRAKANGPGSYEIYAQGMNELAHQRLARESELHQAVRRDELVVRYQPQIDLRTGRIIGVEALVRWDHPTLGHAAAERVRAAGRGVGPHRRGRHLGPAPRLSRRRWRGRPRGCRRCESR